MNRRAARLATARLAPLLAAALLALAGCGGGDDPAPGGPSADEASAQATDGPEDGFAPVPEDARTATVQEVTDGDTVTLSATGDTRLIGVDTPEVTGGAECFGDEASSFTAGRLEPGTEVSYVLGEEEEDRYGRALAYVWLPTDRFFNAMLVARGYATPLAITPNTEYADLFRDLARDARADDDGLWAPRACGGPEQVAPSVGGAESPGGGAGAQAPEAGGAGSSGETDAQPRGGVGDFCEPSYPDICVPPAPPDLDCGDVTESAFAVRGADPHDFDSDGDGVGCDG